MFYKGQKVIYTDKVPLHHPAALHLASMGNGTYMHLNRRGADGQILPVTGVILKVHRGPGGETSYDFGPDGWKPSQSGWPRGFQVDDESCFTLNEQGLCLPGTVTNGCGKVLDNA